MEHSESTALIDDDMLMPLRAAERADAKPEAIDWQRHLPSPAMWLVFALSVVLLMWLPHALAADWYVDGRSGVDGNPGNAGAPFKNVWRAWQMAQPGDTLHLLPTVVYGPLYFSGKSGSAAQPITINGAGAAPRLTQVSGNGTNFGIDLEQGVNYVTLQNLDVSAPGFGPNGPWSAIYLTGNHHVQILNNRVHDAGCSGIQTASSDYITIAGNRVYGNAGLTGQQIFCSGISMHENRDSDRVGGIKMRILNNLVYANSNQAACATCGNSDGNGIIIDDSRRTQTDSVAYQGSTEIVNNLVFNNGGRGIHVYRSDRVTIHFNTLVFNNRDPAEAAWRPGEISAIESGGLRITHNILASAAAAGTAATGNHVALSIQDGTGAPVSADFNLAFNPQNDTAQQVYLRNNAQAVTLGSSNRWADPLFKVLSLDPVLADFRVRNGSAALGFGGLAQDLVAVDINGDLRGLLLTAGAYQLAVQ